LGWICTEPLEAYVAGPIAPVPPVPDGGRFVYGVLHTKRPKQDLGSRRQCLAWLRAARRIVEKHRIQPMTRCRYRGGRAGWSSPDNCQIGGWHGLFRGCLVH